PPALTCAQTKSLPSLVGVFARLADCPDVSTSALAPQQYTALSVLMPQLWVGKDDTRPGDSDLNLTEPAVGVGTNLLCVSPSPTCGSCPMQLAKPAASSAHVTKPLAINEDAGM